MEGRIRSATAGTRACSTISGSTCCSRREPSESSAGRLFFGLFLALVRRARIPDDAGLLCVALLASLVGFVVAMLFIDAFAFPQLTFVAFLVIAMSANVARQADQLGDRLW